MAVMVGIEYLCAHKAGRAGRMEYKQINSKVMKRDLISKIADRAVEMYGCRKIDIVMDLCYCIDGGCNLDLEALLKADDMNFGHDICGIHTHLNHETKQLEHCFLPRFAL